jgi:hypothetical protein
VIEMAVVETAAKTAKLPPAAEVSAAESTNAPAAKMSGATEAPAMRKCRYRRGRRGESK